MSLVIQLSCHQGEIVVAASSRINGLNDICSKLDPHGQLALGLPNPTNGPLILQRILYFRIFWIMHQLHNWSFSVCRRSQSHNPKVWSPNFVELGL